MTSSIDGSLLRFSDHLNMVGRTDDARRRGKHGQHTKEARAERAEVPRWGVIGGPLPVGDASAAMLLGRRVRGL